MSIVTTPEFSQYVIPDIVPEPAFSAAVASPVISLDSDWEVSDGAVTHTVQVPHDMNAEFLQGFGNIYDYDKTIRLPQIPEDSHLVMVFEGVNGFADLYVNGQFVRHHENGLLTWNTDITGEAQGRDLHLHLHVDETKDMVSTFSHGGMLRPAYLYVLPDTYVSALYLTPILSEDYRHARLRMSISLNSDSTVSVQVLINEPSGETVLDKTVPASTHLQFEEEIPDPVLWDAEHPYLYTVTINLIKEGRIIETTGQKTGLRKIERQGNHLYLNGKELKLHGVCRHEITPTNGRATTHDQILKDVKLFKEANINYIRTSHYPPNRYLLELCDEYGIYVEDELALAFISKTLPFTPEDPALTPRYISHFTECLARDYNHPSVIIWSLCNESFGGYNFDQLNRYVHYKDPTRVTKFSYPMTVREEHESPDLWSIHYSEYGMDLGQKRDNVSVGGTFGRDHPVIHDEFCHVPCYNREELRRDPYVRIFWGQGLAKMWEKIFHTDGALGGAIWAGIDDTDIYLGGSSQLEWGIIDVWRRKKPEFYMVRKAYTPVNILAKQGNTLLLENRFCHTDFSEVTMKYTCHGKTDMMRLPKAAPGQILYVTIPLDDVTEKSFPVFLQFFDSQGWCVNEDQIPAMESAMLPTPVKQSGGKISVLEESGKIQLSNSLFTAGIGEDGLISSCRTGSGNEYLGYGPILHFPDFSLGKWQKRQIKVAEKEHSVLVETEGEYLGSLSLIWEMLFSEDGTLRVCFRITKITGKLPRCIKLRVGVDCGGLDEVGIAFEAGKGMDSFSWVSKSAGMGGFDWSPEKTMTCSPQTVCLKNGISHVFGEKPDCAFEEDSCDDILNGKYAPKYEGSNLFRATKENTEEGYFYKRGENFGLRFLGGSCCHHLVLYRGSKGSGYCHGNVQ